MSKMSYLNKRIASFGVATTLALTMSSCSNSIEKNSENTETGFSTSLELEYNSELPIAVPIESVVMENGKIGYKMPQSYYPYIVDENLPIPGMTTILEETAEYQILGGCDAINDNGTTTYCGFEGAVAIYKPYWLLLSLDKEQCDDKKLQLINDVENLADEVYSEQTKAIIKK